MDDETLRMNEAIAIVDEAVRGFMTNLANYNGDREFLDGLVACVREITGASPAVGEVLAEMLKARVRAVALGVV